MAEHVPGGYFGRALVVDVTDGSTRVLPLPEQVLRQHVGGVGLGAWLLHELAPAGVDPLGTEAPLAFVFSPLVGTPLTTSAKFAVVAKSPLTGLLTDALASSHFAISGKLTGHDAIVLVGRAERPSVVRVEGRTVVVEDAGTSWGRTAAGTGSTPGATAGRCGSSCPGIRRSNRPRSRERSRSPGSSPSARSWSPTPG